MTAAVNYQGRKRDTHLLFVRSVADAARGRWRNVLDGLGIAVPSSHTRHGPCPACGGADRFRFDDKEGNGSHICNQCGAGDGLDLVSKVFGCNPLEAARRVAPQVGCEDGRPLTNTELEAVRHKALQHQQKRERQEQAQEQRGISKARAIWEASVALPAGNEYLAQKRVNNHGLRGLAAAVKIGGHHFDAGVAMVPRYRNGELVGVQMIDPHAKRHIGPTKAAYHTIGKPAEVLYICEGYATGATIHEASGQAVAVAFDAGNLLPVGQALKAKYPDTCIIIAADNDHNKEAKGEENTGLIKAMAVADRLVLGLVYPPFEADQDGSDWNDYAAFHGLEATRQALQAGTGGYRTDTGPTQTDAAANPPASPKTRKSRDSVFMVKDHGIYHLGDEEPLAVCAKMEITARTRDTDNGNWGRLLEWKDDDGHPHQWAMPMEMLAGDGKDLREALLRGGLPFISSHSRARRLLQDYISTADIKARARCVSSTGWHGEVFVLPDLVIGNQEQERVILQTSAGEYNHFKQAGTLADWQQHIGRYCVGNSRLAFAVSIPFAAPLLHFVGAEGGGFNFKGNSSEGKSTALKVACSVCGGPDFAQTWRATSNGLEGTAANHNDSLLALDEMGQVDPKEAGGIAYMLANGMGKKRADRSGGARMTKQWRVLFISTGEITLADHMASKGERAKAGQEVRLADIPMNTGKHGGFENLHGLDGGAALADYLVNQAKHYHGTPLRTYLQALAASQQKIKAWVQDVQKEFVSKQVPKEASGQVCRVAHRFALVAAGGEIATRLGLTGWPKGEAISAAKVCFNAWLEQRGGYGNREDKEAIEQVVSFFQRHGQSRFAPWHGTGEETIHNRAGFVRSDDGEVRYYVFPQVFTKEICQGLDSKRVARLCIEKGMLTPASDGKSQQAQRIPDMGVKKVYVFSATRLEGDHD